MVVDYFSYFFLISCGGFFLNDILWVYEMQTIVALVCFACYILSFDRICPGCQTFPLVIASPKISGIIRCNACILSHYDPVLSLRVLSWPATSLLSAVASHSLLLTRLGWCRICLISHLVGGLVAMFYFAIYIGLLIIPIDFHILERSSNHQPAMLC